MKQRFLIREKKPFLLLPCFCFLLCWISPRVEVLFNLFILHVAYFCHLELFCISNWSVPFKMNNFPQHNKLQFLESTQATSIICKLLSVFFFSIVLMNVCKMLAFFTIALLLSWKLCSAIVLDHDWIISWIFFCCCHHFASVEKPKGEECGAFLWVYFTPSSLQSVLSLGHGVCVVASHKS